MKARKGRRKKNFGTPPPVFVKIWGGVKNFCFNGSCIPKASIYALGGGKTLSLQQWLHRSQHNTGTPHPNLCQKWPVLIV